MKRTMIVTVLLLTLGVFPLLAHEVEEEEEPEPIWAVFWV